MCIFFSFSLTNACLPCWLLKAYAIFWVANRFVGSETPKHNTFDQFWKFKLHFDYFPRNIQHLSFDGPTNYLDLFTTNRHFRYQGNVLYPTSKLVKCDLVKSKPFFAYFCCQEGISRFRYFTSFYWYLSGA